MLQNKESDRRGPWTTRTPEGHILWGRAKKKPACRAEGVSRETCTSAARDWVKEETGWWGNKFLPRVWTIAGTAPKPPVWHQETSSRQHTLKGFQTESVPRWLTQVNTTPEIPSGRSGLESRLTSPQTCYQLYNALWFQWRRQVLGGWGEKCVRLEILKCSSYFPKKSKMMLYMVLGHSSSIY